MKSRKCEVASAKEIVGGRSLPRTIYSRKGSALPTSNIKPRKSNFRAGFNLVETLAASMILSGAVLTIGAISTNALTSTRLHRHHELAAAVIDQQLTLIDQVGIDQFVEAGQMEGLCDQFEPAYQWAVTTEYTGTDSLYLVSITVTWLEGMRPYRLTAQTMLNGAALVIGTETEAQQTQ